MVFLARIFREGTCRVPGCTNTGDGGFTLNYGYSFGALQGFSALSPREKAERAERQGSGAFPSAHKEGGGDEDDAVERAKQALGRLLSK